MVESTDLEMDCLSSNSASDTQKLSVVRQVT